MLAQQSLGGGLSSSEETQRDLSAVLAATGEMLPRTSKVWMGMQFEADASGKLVAPSSRKEAASQAAHQGQPPQHGALPKMMDRDGSKAVAALVGQISRLWRGRAEYRAKSREYVGHLRRMQAVFYSCASDFAMFHLQMDRVRVEAARLAVQLSLPGLLEEISAREATVPVVGGAPPLVAAACDRMALVEVALRGLSEAVIAAREEAHQLRSLVPSAPALARDEAATAAARHVDLVSKYRDSLVSAYGSTMFLDTAAIAALIKEDREKQAGQQLTGEDATEKKPAASSSAVAKKALPPKAAATQPAKEAASAPEPQ